MRENKKEAVANRRNFLKLAGATAASGGAAILGSEKTAEAAEAAPKQSLYRETDHIRRYYELAR